MVPIDTNYYLFQILFSQRKEGVCLVLLPLDRHEVDSMIVED